MVSAVDPAINVISVFVDAMRRAFNPDDTIAPPTGGGSKNVRVFAGDGVLPPSLIQATGCDTPLLWVRAAQRYLSEPKSFPSVRVRMPDECEDTGFHTLGVEIGVGRCSSMESGPTWDDLAAEADASLDDSWRLSLALDLAACDLRSKVRAFAADTIAPYGPEGGVIAWTAVAYVQLRED